MVQPPKNVDPVYARSGYIHPVQTQQGKIVTDAFPADHLHQNGIFNGWVNTDFKGHSVDFWNLHKRQGAVMHEKLLRSDSGPIVGGFSVLRHHVVLTDSGSAHIVLQEEWRVLCILCSGGASL